MRPSYSFPFSVTLSRKQVFKLPSDFNTLIAKNFYAVNRLVHTLRQERPIQMCGIKVLGQLPLGRLSRLNLCPLCLALQFNFRALALEVFNSYGQGGLLFYKSPRSKSPLRYAS